MLINLSIALLYASATLSHPATLSKRAPISVVDESISTNGYARELVLHERKPVFYYKPKEHQTGYTVSVDDLHYGAVVSTKSLPGADISGNEPVLLGYHGTNEANAENIKKYGFQYKKAPLLDKYNQYGPGIYTTKDIETASYFARGVGGKPVILEIWIDHRNKDLKIYNMPEDITFYDEPVENRISTEIHFPMLMHKRKWKRKILRMMYDYDLIHGPHIKIYEGTNLLRVTTQTKVNPRLIREGRVFIKNGEDEIAVREYASSPTGLEPPSKKRKLN